MAAIPDRAIGPVVKIKRAKEHFDKLAPEIVEFVRSHPYGFVAEFDPETSEHVIKIRVLKHPSPFWGAAVGDIVHNLRSALDLLACRLVEAGGGTVKTGPRGTSFPVSDSAEEFARSYIGKVEGAAKGATDLIKDQEPYQGGEGDLIWRLHQFDIADKHHLLVPILGLFPEQSGRIRIKRNGMATETETRFPRVFPLKDGTEIVRYAAGVDPSQVQVQLNAAVRVAFGQPKVVEGQPVLPTLMEFGPYIESVVSQFYSFL